VSGRASAGTRWPADPHGGRDGVGSRPGRERRRTDDARQWPAIGSEANVELELGPLYELSDFAPGEALEHHERLRERLAQE
jgi:hypothetical protein